MTGNFNRISLHIRNQLIDQSRYKFKYHMGFDLYFNNEKIFESLKFEFSGIQVFRTPTISTFNAKFEIVRAGGK